MKYFSDGKKVCKEDLYNFEDEYDSLVKAIESDKTRLIVVTGIRRIGKSSLVNVVLKEIKWPFIWIDTREMGYFDDDNAFRCFEDAFASFLNENRSFAYKMKKVLENIKGFEIKGLFLIELIDLKIKERKPQTISNFLKMLDKQISYEQRKIIFAIDEAQNLQNIVWLANVLAFANDNLKNIKIILTGSEIDLINKFIGKDNPSSPLFGRNIFEINLSPLSNEKSKEFLRKGFHQEEKTIDENHLLEVISRIGGITGWLNAYGCLVSSGNKTHKDALEEIQTNSTNLAKDELIKFLKGCKNELKYFIAILNIINSGDPQYEKIKGELKNVDVNINDEKLHDYLARLQQFTFIKKKGRNYLYTNISIKRAINDILNQPEVIAELLK